MCENQLSFVAPCQCACCTTKISTACEYSKLKNNFCCIKTCKGKNHSHQKFFTALVCRNLFPKIIFTVDYLAHLICIGCTNKQQSIMEQKVRRVLIPLSF